MTTEVSLYQCVSTRRSSVRLNDYLHILDSLRLSWSGSRSGLCRLLFLLFLLILSLLYGAAAGNMAALVIFVLPPLLVALLPASLGGQLGQRPVDVVRGVTVVCGGEAGFSVQKYKRCQLINSLAQWRLQTPRRMLTFDVLLVVAVVLFIRHRGGGAQDLLETLDAQSFVQVPVILLFTARSPVSWWGGRSLWLQHKRQINT